MSQFSEYEKMPQGFLVKEEDTFTYRRLKKEKWVATEKIHGANFSFIYENATLKFAKRKALLSWQDDFFGFQAVVEKLEDSILALMESIYRRHTGYKVIVYGELLGGSYPHATIESVKNVQAIQTGVYYSPGIHFCAFDIALQSESSKFYLDYEESLQFFEAFDILHAAPLKIGTLTEVMEFNTRISSKIPQVFDLPVLENNLIEGIVIKPLRHREWIGEGDRPIFKIKNKEFEEDPKFHEAEKWSYVPDARSRAEELEYILSELRNYINVNRLNSAISKIGAPDPANQERMTAIQKECEEDALLDFNLKNPGILSDLTKDDAAWIQQRIQHDIQLLLLRFPN